MKAAKKKNPAKKSAAKKAAKNASNKKKKVVKQSSASTTKPVKKKLVAKKSAPKKAAVKKAVAKKQSKKKKEDLMCFLTTACVHHYGLADNCYELETLRKYRDSYLMQHATGKALVKDYYALAPSILKQISTHPKKEKYYTYIYNRVLSSCRAIEDKQFEQARRIYQGMVVYLKGQVLVAS